MKLYIAVILLVFGFSGCFKKNEDPSTNDLSNKSVIVILADDLGHPDYYPPNFRNYLENINKLASESISFNNSYVAQASCSPSRASILTGLYPHQNGQIGLAYDSSPFMLNADIETLPAILKNSGIYTGIIGKLHVNPLEKFSFNYRDLDFGASRKESYVLGHLDQFLDKAKNKPFFLLLGLFDPHTQGDFFVDEVEGLPTDLVSSNQVTALPFQLMTSGDSKTRIASYLNSAKRFDILLGESLRMLKERGKYDNSMIIVTSDHGFQFSRGKLSSYEPGIRVPLIVKHPKVTSPISTDRFTSLVDLFPTVLDFFNVENDVKNSGLGLFQDSLGVVSSGHEFIVSEFSYHKKGDFYPRRSVREDRYKLIWNADTTITMPFGNVAGDMIYETMEYLLEDDIALDLKERYLIPPQFELYDLQNDPMELINLAEEANYKEVMEELKRKLLDWQKETDDSILVPIEG